MDISNVPLPNQEPQPADLTKYSYDVLQSQAVSDLVSQNEDLMARLSINLKRNAELEGRLFQESQKVKDTHRKQNLLNDQVLILKEKNRILTEKHDELLKKVINAETELKSQTEQSLLTYSALESQLEALRNSEANLKTVLTSVQESFEKRLSLYLRYRRRIQKYVGPQLINLKSQFLQLVDDVESLKTDWFQQKKVLEVKLQRLSRYRRRVSVLHPKYKEKINTLARVEKEQELLLQNHMNLKSKQEDLLTLIASQKDLMQSQLEQIQDLEKSGRAKDYENRSLQQRNETLMAKEKDQQLKMVELENQAIEAQRRFADRSQINAQDLATVQEKLTQNKEVNAQQVLAIQHLKEKIQVLEDSLRESKLQNDRLESENISLRTLWSDHRQKSEEFKLQESSSRALNQELMDKLKEERQEADKLRSQILVIENNYQKRIEELLKQINFLTQSATNEREASPAFDAEQMQRFAKMETLIAEIQTGFTKDLPQDIS